MRDDLTGRVAVITGASGGIGGTVTRRWLEAGATVVAAASTADSLEKLTDGVGDLRSRLVTFPADLTTAAGCESVIEHASSHFGYVDTLIHLVGGFAFGAFDDPKGVDTWSRMVALNATSAYHAFRATIPHLRQRGGGWIVVLAARAATEAAPNMAAYAASKAALVSLVRSVAAEVRDEEIHVNAILTSVVDTPANRAAMGADSGRKWVTADDIADATFYLCSPQAGAVNGAALEVYAKS